MVGALAMEMLPFNVIPFEEGRKAIIEYVVWREHPEQADGEIVQTAVRLGIETMLEQGGSEVVGGLRKAPFPWVSLLT